MRWIALLRGINVGGANRIAMADLRALCATLPAQNVRSYIASGNLVFDTDEKDGVTADALDLADRLSSLLTAQGCDVPVLILPADDIIGIYRDCPFPKDAGKAVHAFFCFKTPSFDKARFDDLRIASERIEVKDKTVWLHAPEGIGKSKLAEKIGQVIRGTDMTARNLNTVAKLAEMAR